MMPDENRKILTDTTTTRIPFDVSGSSFPTSHLKLPAHGLDFPIKESDPSDL